MSRTVLPNDDGIRPAGAPDSCFYCKQPVGSDHKPECVALHKAVKMRFEIELDVETPHSWDSDTLDFYYNESSWCADNLIDMLRDATKDKCLCSRVYATVIDANMDSAPYTKTRDA